MGKLLWYVPPRPPHSFPRAPFNPRPAAMNARFPLLAAAIILTVVSSVPATAATETLFSENFDGNTSGLWSSSSGTPLFENTGWTYSTAYKAYYSIRMGGTSSTGSATTPEIPLKNGWLGATVTVTFQSAAWYGTSSGLTLSKIEGGRKTLIDSWSVPKIANDKSSAEAITDFSVYVSDANGKQFIATFDVYGPFQLVFETTGSGDNRRAYLDSVSVVGEESVSPPDVTATGVSSSSVTISWPAQTTAASYAVRAWTLVPVNEVTEFFTDWYNQNLTLPQGWTKEGDLGRYAVVASPIAFNDNNQSLTSPTFAGTVSSLSFVVRRYNGNTDKPSTFRVYGSSGESGVEWTLLKELDLFTQIGTSGTSVSINSDSVPDLANYHCFRFVYEKDGGNCGFGSFSVTGTGVGKQPSYLTGYGPDATAVAGTSVTISNPVAGETNYIEVTATGLSGKTASATIAVPVPAVATPKPAVISVK